LAITSSTAFLSYSRSDSDFALKLAEDLQAAGASVWLDQIELEPGRPWDIEIQRALMACNRMLVVLSPASVNSTNVLDEVSFALKKQKTVIPVLYQDCEIPLRLDRLQYVDLTNYSRGLKILLRSLTDPSHSRPAPPVLDLNLANQPGLTPAPVTVVPAAPPPQPPASTPGEDPRLRQQILRGLDGMLNPPAVQNSAPVVEPPQPKPDAGILDELSRLISGPGH
jgi:TIR domain